MHGNLSGTADADSINTVNDVMQQGTASCLVHKLKERNKEQTDYDSLPAACMLEAQILYHAQHFMLPLVA
jgi:hypothetical protein